MKTTCPVCGGEGKTMRLYGGYSSFYGQPLELETECESCDGTGEIMIIVMPADAGDLRPVDWK